MDGAVAMKDVYPLLLSAMKHPSKAVDASAGRIGISWASGGGESSGLVTVENYLACDGIENVIRVLEDLEDDGEVYESIEEIWPDYPSKEDFFFNEDEY